MLHPDDCLLSQGSEKGNAVRIKGTQSETELQEKRLVEPEQKSAMCLTEEKEFIEVRHELPHSEI